MVRFFVRGAILTGLLGLVVFSQADRLAQAALLAVNPPKIEAYDDGIVKGFKWTYQVALPKNQFLVGGNYFTVFDFAGYQGKSGYDLVYPAWHAKAGQPVDGIDHVGGDAAAWTFQSLMVGPTPKPANDSAALPNLTWTYNVGSSIISSTSGEEDTYQGKTLGFFWAISQYDHTFLQYVQDNFASVNKGANDSQENEFPDDSEKNVTSTAVPVAKAPEPTTLLMMGIGLPLMGAYRLVRRRQSAI